MPDQFYEADWLLYFHHVARPLLCAAFSGIYTSFRFLLRRVWTQLQPRSLLAFIYSSVRHFSQPITKPSLRTFTTALRAARTFTCCRLTRTSYTPTTRPMAHHWPFPSVASLRLPLCTMRNPHVEFYSQEHFPLAPFLSQRPFPPALTRVPVGMYKIHFVYIFINTHCLDVSSKSCALMVCHTLLCSLGPRENIFQKQALTLCFGKRAWINRVERLSVLWLAA